MAAKSTAWSQAVATAVDAAAPPHPQAGSRLRPVTAARPALPALAFLAVTTLYLAVTQNLSLFQGVLTSLPRPFALQEWQIAGSAFITLVNVLVLSLLPFSAPRVVRPAAAFFVLSAAVGGYFMDAFGVVIDRSMVLNVMRTNVNEAGQLLQVEFWRHVLIYGVLPAVGLAWFRVSAESFGSVVASRLLVATAVLALQAAVVVPQFNALGFWGRAHRDLRLLINPTSPLYATYKYFRGRLPSRASAAPIAIAADAVRAAPIPGQRPFVAVLVVGETARAQNFELNGYDRGTNPRLRLVPDLVNFPDTRSCGTATAQSVPCLFSGIGRPNFSEAKADAQENLLDVLQRVGVDVQWWENDFGCQGVCDRVATRRLEKADEPVLCLHGECRDGILLRDLDAFLAGVQSSALLVLHMNGSHGPAYSARYPESARVFRPDCRDANVQRCSRAEIVNAYDNSLVYTDSVLADLIGRLRGAGEHSDIVMMYVSDHGESLGERGVYLHGLPYAIAPAEQTRVPLLAWFSPGAYRDLRIDEQCLAKRALEPASHDNLFHSVLGLFAVKTRLYQPELDLFASCRKPARHFG